MFFVCDKDISSLVNRLEHMINLATEWFQNNYMNLNEDKNNLILGEGTNMSVVNLVLLKFGKTII